MDRAALRDDRGSLPMLMLVVLVGMALAALMIPLVMTQTHTTTFDTQRGRALQAAESGIDVALGQIRAATSKNKDGALQGDSSKLPCGPLDGIVGSSDDGYSVDIAYYSADPSVHDAQWGVQHKMICVSGYGVHEKDTEVYTPSYILLSSQGTTANGESRTLVGTYVVKTTNTNIPGGPIRVWPKDGSPSYCMDAGSLPQAGTSVTLSLCPTGNQVLTAGMSFTYNPDLTIQLSASVGDTTMNPTGYGLCLSSSGSNGSSITLANCSAPKNPPWQQVWSVDDSSHLRGSNSSKSDTSSSCVEVATQGIGAQLKLQACAGGTTDTAQTWLPSPAVGAGQAGATNSQLVNFQQFGRCLDVTNQQVTGTDSGAEFLILYTCKQNPNPSNVAWNQKFAASPAITDSAPVAVQWITNNGSNYCLTSPGTDGGHVVVTKCASSGDSKKAQMWTTYQTQDSSGNELAYKDKFTIRDYQGRCMSLSGTDDLYNGQYQKAIVETCDGSTEQKWNAMANVQDPVLEDIHEK